MARPKAGTTFWDRVHQHTALYMPPGREFGDALGFCYLFTGSRDANGYGRINKDGKLVRIHREVWKREHGEIPVGMVVCHKCDIPNCISASHLFLGTQSDNVADMWAKGRAENLRRWGNTNTKGKNINVGSKHGRAIFSEVEVLQIKMSLFKDNSWKNVLALSEKYKCSKTAINHIRRGTRWRHVNNDPASP